MVSVKEFETNQRSLMNSIWRLNCLIFGYSQNAAVLSLRESLMYN